MYTVHVSIISVHKYIFKWIYLPLGGDEMFDWSNDIKDGVLDNTSLDCVDSTSTSPGEHF